MATPYSALPAPPTPPGAPSSPGGPDPGQRHRRRANLVTTWALVFVVIGGGTLAATSLHAHHIAQTGTRGTFVASTTAECHTVHHTSTTHHGHHTTHHTSTSQSCTWTGPFASDDGTVHVDAAFLTGRKDRADGRTLRVSKLAGSQVYTTTGGSTLAVTLSILVLLLLTAVVAGRVRWGRNQR